MSPRNVWEVTEVLEGREWKKKNKNTGTFFPRVAFLFIVSSVGCFIQSSVNGSLESSQSPEYQGKYPFRGGLKHHPGAAGSCWMRFAVGRAGDSPGIPPVCAQLPKAQAALGAATIHRLLLALDWSHQTVGSCCFPLCVKQFSLSLFQSLARL